MCPKTPLSKSTDLEAVASYGVCLMKFVEAFPNAPMEDDRLKEVEDSLAAAGRLTARYHRLSGLASRTEFFAEFVRDYENGKQSKFAGVTIPHQDARIMFVAKQLETEVIAGFSAMMDGLVSRAAHRFGRDYDDLVGEAFRSFFDALVHYTGGVRFSTFLHVCIRRHLSRVCSTDRAIRVPRQTRKITMRVVDRMHRDGVSFDEAVESEGVPQKKVGVVVAAMSKVCSATDLDIRESDMAASQDSPRDNGEAVRVMRAIETAGLGRLERAVLKGFMDAPSGSLGLSKGCAGLTNPDTGRPYSRTAISHAWKQVRKKIAVALREVA